MIGYLVTFGYVLGIFFTTLYCLIKATIEKQGHPLTIVLGLFCALIFPLFWAIKLIVWLIIEIKDRSAK